MPLPTNVPRPHHVLLSHRSATDLGLHSSSQPAATVAAAAAAAATA
eukprot:CAMPEP_0206500084 /NCGR_PEP_ID=MMETSP0324_2-20121206/52181_1 /ASSEMBLY_ACC=CAM_ASM_000836 /TAXON_ID=2866 /ORGANISM="Crypthecodinium cohnii, Strain Seligo" /LENGTH=45 /DNA_ID= /DNA_START= /DNA_END= /DNA_ORIENTATION=